MLRNRLFLPLRPLRPLRLFYFRAFFCKFIALVLVLCWPVTAFSQTDTNCDVRVRLIQGSNSESKIKGPDKKLRMASYLSGLQDQLSTLPFSDYESLVEEKQRVFLGNEAVFTLSDPDGGSHTITIRPLKRSGAKVRTMVDWKGPEGSNLVSTKLGLVNGQNMVLGADGSGSSSIIISMLVLCGV